MNRRNWFLSLLCALIPPAAAVIYLRMPLATEWLKMRGWSIGSPDGSHTVAKFLDDVRDQRAMQFAVYSGFTLKCIRWDRPSLDAVFHIPNKAELWRFTTVWRIGRKLPEPVVARLVSGHPISRCFAPCRLLSPADGP
jgi:hypothetical protein